MTHPSSPTPSPEEKRALKNSIAFAIVVAVFAIIIAIGLLSSTTEGENGFAGLMMLAVIAGPIFLIISLIYHIALIPKATTRSRKLYAIIATIVTGLLACGVVVAIILSSLRS